jgi:type IV pilus assembly protein PilC
MQALSYPIVVILIAVGVVAFMLGMVVPMFEDIFSRFDATLPAITQAIMGASAFFRNHIFFLLGFLLLVGGLGMYLAKKASVRLFLSNLILKVPIVGNMLLHLHMARLASGLNMLMEAKVPLDQALGLVQEMLGFAPFSVVMRRVRETVIQGESFNEAVKREKIFPISFTQMIAVGEKTARLTEMLAHYAKATEEEAEARLNQLTQLLEPMLILTLGGLVALILVAMYLPMFELSSVMG